MLNYLTSSQASTSQKIPLDSTESEDYFLEVISVHSEQYRLNKSAIYKKVAEADSDYFEKNKTAIMNELLAGSVKAWRVPKEFGKCTIENVVKLFKEFPQISDIVDVFIVDNQAFIAKK